MIFLKLRKRKAPLVEPNEDHDVVKSQKVKKEEETDEQHHTKMLDNPTLVGEGVVQKKS